MLLSNSTPADGQLGPGSPHEGDSGPVWYNHPAESVPGMSALFSANRKWWLGDSVELCQQALCWLGNSSLCALTATFSF